MKLYKGRIPDDPSPLMDRINRSLPFDIRLLPWDVATNRAWAGQLLALGIYREDEYAAVCRRLDEILAMHEAGAFDPLPADEDVHTLVERLLTESLGATGARIHTGRSRNDQVVTDLRLYLADQLLQLMTALRRLIEVLKETAERHAATLMAGTTHLQPALPITLGHFLLSLAFALVRDHERLATARTRVARSPLGAGAMAGSGFPVDRAKLAAELGFAEELPNSIDAVADRDFCQEPVQACAILTSHLSRYAEQFIIWANPAFGYLRFADAWSTGSSMMPQKRNPDAMELVRGKASRVIGAANTLLCLTKGLPLTYAKDLQEDKEPLFDALDTSLLVVRVFSEALASAVFFPEKLAAGLRADMLATDLADLLVMTGVPFREAHERVAGLVSRLERGNRDLLCLTPAELQADFPEFGDAPPRLDYAASVARRAVAGGTAPAALSAQLRQLESFLQANR